MCLLGGEWQAPLALILLVFFGAGLLLGLVAALLTTFQLKREIRQLNRALQHQTRSESVLPPIQSNSDGHRQ